MKKFFLKWLLKDTDLGFSINYNSIDKDATLNDCSIDFNVAGNIILNEVVLPKNVELIIRKKI